MRSAGRGGHLLGLVDDEHRAQQRGLDVGVPRVAQGLEAAPAIARGERHAEQVAELAIEVGDAALRMLDDADHDVAERGEPRGDDTQGGGLADTGVAADEGEAALAHQVFQPPAEVLEPGRDDKRFRRDLGRERIPLEPVELQERTIHQASSVGR
jgi:hypothetical protein